MIAFPGYEHGVDDGYHTTVWVVPASCSEPTARLLAQRSHLFNLIRLDDARATNLPWSSFSDPST